MCALLSPVSMPHFWITWYPRKNRSIRGTMRAGSSPLQVEGYLVEVAERFGQRLFYHQP